MNAITGKKMTTNLEVQGRLTDDTGKNFVIRLQLIVESISGSDERFVSECKIASNMVPDGIYAAEYFYFKEHRFRCRVKSGILCRPNSSGATNPAKHQARALYRVQKGSTSVSRTLFEGARLLTNSKSRASTVRHK